MNITKIVEAWLAQKDLATEFPDLTAAQRSLIPRIACGSASNDEMEAAGQEYVVGLKASTDMFQRRYGVGGAMLDKVSDDEPVIPWILNQESTDREGDVIRAKGWQLKNYKQNPVVIWMHGGGFFSMDVNAHEPFARGERARKEDIKGVPSLVADIRFAVEESEAGARRFRLSRGGFINAGSVGFFPLKTEHVADEDERNDIGLGRFGILFVKQELLEYSLVSVPAHPGALQIGGKSFGKMGDALVYGRKNGIIEDGDDDMLVEDLKRTLPEVEWEKQLQTTGMRFFTAVRGIDSAVDEVAESLAALVDDDAEPEPNPEGNGAEATADQDTPASADDADNTAGEDPAPSGDPEPDGDGAPIEATATELALIEVLQKNTAAFDAVAASQRMLAKALTATLGGVNGGPAGPDAETPDAGMDADVQGILRNLKDLTRHFKDRSKAARS